MAFSTGRVTCRWCTFLLCLHATNLFFYFYSFFEWLSGNAVVLFLPLLSSNRGAGILLPRLVDRLSTANVRRGKRRLRQRCLVLVTESGVCAGLGLGSLPVGCEVGCIEIGATCHTACRCCYPCLEARMCVPATIGWALDLSVHCKEHLPCVWLRTKCWACELFRTKAIVRKVRSYVSNCNSGCFCKCLLVWNSFLTGLSLASTCGQLPLLVQEDL